MANKKGWIRVVEATIALLFLAGVILLVINLNNNENVNVSGNIYDKEVSMLREIQFNSSLRNSVLQENTAVIQNKIDEIKPASLTCKIQICASDANCFLSTSVDDKDVYAESIIISADTSQSGPYSSKKLKLFCWKT